MGEPNSKSIEERLEELEAEVSSASPTEQERIRTIKNMHLAEWNRDREPEYQLRPEDELRSLEYSLDYREKGRHILVYLREQRETNIVFNVLKGMMKRYGLQIMEAQNFEHARSCLPLLNYNLIISESPQEGEESILKEAKKQDVSISTMLLSDKNEQIVDTEQVDGIIRKPIDIKDAKIIDKINELCIRSDVIKGKLELKKLDNDIRVPQPDLDFLRYQSLLEKQVADIERMLAPDFDNKDKMSESVYEAKPIFPGAASAKIFSDLAKATEHGKKGGNTMLYVDDLTNLKLIEVRRLKRARGIIFNQFSTTSHAVIDLMNAGIPMIQAENTATKKGEFKFGDFTTKEGETVAFDGITGKVYSGHQRVVPSPIVNRIHATDGVSGKVVADFDEVIKDCNEVLAGRMNIMINAHTVDAVNESIQYGVGDVGLVRSEDIVKETQDNIKKYCAYLMTIVSDKKTPKVRARKAFKDMQVTAFYNILKSQKGRRTQIRLLDAPFKEFFDDKTIDDVAKERKGIDSQDAKKLKEIVNDPERQRTDRGVVIAVKYPEVYETQIEALMEAYAKLKAEEPEAEIDLKIFIPYVSNLDQVRLVKEKAESLNDKIHGGKIEYDLVVTLETVPGLFIAPRMLEMGIKHFTFGTNDLFPMIENAERDKGGGEDYTVDEESGQYLMNPIIEEALTECLQKMAATGISRDQYEVGISGEMNEVKIRNLKRLMPALDYVSASRPKQIPSIELTLAQVFIENYRDMKVNLS